MAENTGMASGVTWSSIESARDDIASLAYQGAEAGAVAVVKMGGDIPDCRVMLGAAQQYAGQQRIDWRQLLRQRLEKIDAEASRFKFLCLDCAQIHAGQELDPFHGVFPSFAIKI